MQLDNPRAFDVLADDRIRLTGAGTVPCSLLTAGEISNGGARQFQQIGEHFYIRVEKALMPRMPAHNEPLTLEKAGAALVKEVHEEGLFYVIVVTAHARRPR